MGTPMLVWRWGSHFVTKHAAEQAEYREQAPAELARPGSRVGRPGAGPDTENIQSDARSGGHGSEPETVGGEVPTRRVEHRCRQCQLACQALLAGRRKKAQGREPENRF